MSAEAANVDAAPAEKEAQEMVPEMDWKEYFRPANVTKLLHKKFGLFSAVVGVYYLTQFVACVSAVNMYSDATRNAQCIDANDVNDLGVTGDEASAVMDPAITLLAIYHIIEWIRCTILLTVVCLGVNLMHVWYATALNSVYGLIIFIYCHVVYASPRGMSCALNQPTRYSWLMTEIILFWVTFWIFLFPPIILRFFPKSKIHETLYMPTEESDEEDEDGEKADE